MFKTQIQELTILSEGLCDEIAEHEEKAKEKRAQLRDVNQALASLERVQSKYAPKEVETTDEDANISI